MRLPERFGHASRPRPSGSVVWLHAASVGESLSVLPLLDALHKAAPDVTFLMTTGTVTSARLMAEKLPPYVIHQFTPVDALPVVRRFLKHWKPDTALFVESELWPNMLCETAKQGCPVILINARMSQRSFRQWQRFPGLIRKLLTCTKLILAQSAQDAERFQALGAQQVQMPGNLKYASPPLPCDDAALTTLRHALQNRPCWLASSTHEGEETLAGEIHAALVREVLGLLTIIVPRHPHRGEAIAQALQKLGLKVSRRSQAEALTADTSVYLADTMGELGLFYRLSPIVFIGGSMVPHGGQNPLEPARLGCAILCGPYMDNFLGILEDFRQHQGIREIHNAKHLQAEIHCLLKEDSQRAQLVKAAAATVAESDQVLERTVTALLPWVRPV